MITIKRTALAKALRVLETATRKWARAHRRPLAMVKFHGLDATATDLEIAVTARLDGDGMLSPTAVELAELRRVVNKMKGKGPITLERVTDAPSILRVSQGGASVALPTFPVEELPRIDHDAWNAEADAGWCEFPAAELVDVLQRCEFAATDDATRFQMHSVFFGRREGSETVREFVATDGKRMTVARLACTMHSQAVAPEVIIPLPAVRAILQAAKGSKNLLSVTRANIGASRAYGRIGLVGFDVSFRCVEGKYPEYRRAIPTGAMGIAATVKRAELLDAVEAAATACVKPKGKEAGTMSLELGFVNGTLTLTGKGITGEDGICPSSSASVPYVSHVCRGPFTVHYNPVYLRDYLRATDDAEILVQCRDERTAGLFSTGTVDHVVMPLVVMGGKR